MRLDHRHALPEASRAMSQLERVAEASTLDPTLFPETGVHAEVAHLFEPEEQVALTLAIGAINGWNRLAVGFRQPVGGFASHLHPVPA